MPGKRPVKKGSFGTHFDELVKHFPDDQPAPTVEPRNQPKLDPKDIHDRLFESAWSRARGEWRPHHSVQRRAFSNQ